MIADIEGFFQRNANAAEALGLDVWHPSTDAPFLHVHGDGRVECLPTHEAVREFFLALSWKSAQRDHGGGRFLDLEIKPLGSAAALVSLTWGQFKADGSVYRRRRSYNLLRIDTDWKSWSRRLIATNTPHAPFYDAIRTQHRTIRHERQRDDHLRQLRFAQGPSKGTGDGLAPASRSRHGLVHGAASLVAAGLSSGDRHRGPHIMRGERRRRGGGHPRQAGHRRSGGLYGGPGRHRRSAWSPDRPASGGLHGSP